MLSMRSRLPSDWQTIAHVPNLADCLFCKVLLEHMAMLSFLQIVISSFCASTAESSSCGRDYMACKA